jgi:hypothetical protein
MQSFPSLQPPVTIASNLSRRVRWTNRPTTFLAHRNTLSTGIDQLCFRGEAAPSTNHLEVGAVLLELDRRNVRLTAAGEIGQLRFGFTGLTTYGGMPELVQRFRMGLSRGHEPAKRIGVYCYGVRALVCVGRPRRTSR